MSDDKPQTVYDEVLESLNSGKKATVGYARGLKRPPKPGDHSTYAQRFEMNATQSKREEVFLESLEINDKGDYIECVITKDTEQSLIILSSHHYIIKESLGPEILLKAWQQHAWENTTDPKYAPLHNQLQRNTDLTPTRYKTAFITNLVCVFDIKDTKFIDLPIKFVFKPGAIPEFSMRDISTEQINEVISFEGTIMKADHTVSFDDLLEVTYTGLGKKRFQITKDDKDPIVQIQGIDFNSRFYNKVGSISKVPMQKLIIEEVYDKRTKRQPRRIECRAYTKEMTERWALGEHAKFVGVVRSERPEFGRQPDTMDKLHIDIIHIEQLTDSDEIKMGKSDLEKFHTQVDADADIFLGKIINSFAPQISGQQIPKTLLLLSMLGGSNLGIDNRGTKIRSQIMALFIGEAGTAKSTLLEYAVKMRYKGVYADAPGASAAGLKYGQDKDGMLFPGLAVAFQFLALDELHLEPALYAELKTVIEGQVASYNKRGHYRNTPLDLTVVAGISPFAAKQNYDVTESIIKNAEPLPPDFLTRFIICRIIKNRDTQEVSQGLDTILDVMEGAEQDKVDYTFDQLQKYIAVARHRTPKMDPQAAAILKSCYMSYERTYQPVNGDMPTTYRIFQDLIRLSASFAKLLNRDLIDKDCAERAWRLYAQCGASIKMDMGKGLPELEGVTEMKTDIIPGKLLMQKSPINKIDAFWICFNECVAEDDPAGKLVHRDSLTDKMMGKFPKHFETIEFSREFIMKLAGRGNDAQLYEPSNYYYGKVD